MQAAQRLPIEAAPPAAPAMAPPMTALRSLFLLAMHHGCHLTPEQIVQAQDGPAADGDLTPGLMAVLRAAGFQTRAMRQAQWDDILKLGSAFPVLAALRSGGWLIVAGVLGTGADAQLAVLDPAREALGITLLTRDIFLPTWRGTLLFCKKPAATRAEPNFGLAWFVPEILRHGGILRDVTIAAFASSLIGLATPLLYHVVIDKVVPYRAEQTLVTVLVIFGIVTLFDAVFTFSRARLMLFMTNKVDASLAARTFAKLLSLPMPFFEQHPAGVLVRHMQQTEKLRQFLTGRLFQCVLDCAMLPILLVLLCIYSFALTLLVLCFACTIAGFIFLLIPHFRSRLNELYAAEGARQSHLVETIHGMRTIKSLAMEPVRQAAWDSRTAATISRHASVGVIAAFANTATAMLDRLMQISILGIGAHAVFTGQMTIGALVAFAMLATRVSGPLLQIVGLINEYQETALSAQMLASVMDHPPERPPGQTMLRPALSGAVSMDQVSFRYPNTSLPALDRVCFAAPEGTVIGIVGRSGSGKTTLIRLLQGIEAPQSGMIRFSGTDIRHIDLTHLRQSTGVVLQESFLFRGTLRENIAASKPKAHFSEIVQAARMAGADEFIDRLPLGYDTMVEESASNFSGGQRQRVSIARALLTRPKLLIFDEATSALDPESEAILQRNLKQIADGRTMIVVSHRLSSLVQADRILVLEHGSAVDFAPHAVLLQRCSLYRGLWEQQTRHLAA